MDTFDAFSLECFISKSKEKIINRLNKLNSNTQTILNNRDWICMVLDQTPNMLDDIQPPIIYQIPQSNNQTFSESKTTSNILLDLESRHFNSSVSGSSSQNKNHVNDNIRDTNKQEENIINNDYKPQIEKMLQGLISSLISKVVSKRNCEQENNDKDTTKQSQFTLNKEIIDKPSLLSNRKIRVYLFNTVNFIDIDVLQDDSFRIIKKKIYSKLLNSVNLITQLREVEGYEFIEMKIEEDKEIPKYGNLLIKDTQKVFAYGKDVIGFVEKVDYINTSKTLLEKAKINVVGNVLSKSELAKINLRVHIKIEQTNSYSTVIQANSECSLRSILEKIKTRLFFKNMDYYYFVEHSSYSDNEDIEKAINFDILLKYLTTYELDVRSIFIMLTIVVSEKISRYA